MVAEIEGLNYVRILRIDGGLMPKKISRSTGSGKTLRVRDPIHDLIVFEGKSELDQLAWRLLNTKEFQRLRRIKQLGFSELTYPGASHSRFSHSVGVFHAARQLVSIIKNKFSKTDDDRLVACLCAALLHDIGHGPFSHVFERQLKTPTLKKVHEKWTCNIISADTDVFRVLNEFDPKLPARVVKIIESRSRRYLCQHCFKSVLTLIDWIICDVTDTCVVFQWGNSIAVGLLRIELKLMLLGTLTPSAKRPRKSNGLFLIQKRAKPRKVICSRDTNYIQLYISIRPGDIARGNACDNDVLGRVIEAIRAKMSFDIIGLAAETVPTSLSAGSFRKQIPDVSEGMSRGFVREGLLASASVAG